jgi:hypothetical protein
VAPSAGNWSLDTVADDPVMATRFEDEVTRLADLKKMEVARIFIPSSGSGGLRVATANLFIERRLPSGRKVFMNPMEPTEAVWLELGDLLARPLCGNPLLLFRWDTFMIGALDVPGILQNVVDAYRTRFQGFEPEELEMHAYFAAPKHAGDRWARIRQACDDLDVCGSYERRLPPHEDYPYPGNCNVDLRGLKSLGLLLCC